MACKCALDSSQSTQELNKIILRVFIENTVYNDDNKAYASTTTFPNDGFISCEAPQISKFNVFEESHMMKAHETAMQLSKIPLCDMIETLCCWRKSLDPSLVDYLARIALWKHPDSKNLALPLAYQTLPHRYFDIDTLSTADQNETCPHTRAKELLSLDNVDYSCLDPEYKLAWWREDPGLALHHHNWHVYYPYTEPVRDRQGELFAYMHEQMLARYDFERLALGMERVRAFGPGWAWEKPLKEGYNPRMTGISFRPSELTVSEVFRKEGRLILTDLLHRSKEIFFYSLARGYLESPDSAKVDITMNKLGNTVEANMGSVNKKLYGNLHNNGHCVIAAMNDPDGRYAVDPGPMFFTETAPRDPVFYRWHKFCDAIFEEHRINMKPYSLQDLRNRVIEVLSISAETGFNDVPSKEDYKLNTLYTFMENKEFTIYTPQQCKIKKNIMNHIPFKYKLNVRNSGIKTVMVAFRVFLAPITEQPLEQWRNMFVELDKFVETIEGGKEMEIYRGDKESSVILPPEISVQDIQEGNTSQQSRCGCGWPINLLIPSGSTNGMKCVLFVLATDWSEDAVNPLEVLPGSVSYCGKFNDLYPDKRPMGFPFDRTTTFNNIESIVNEVPNSCSALVSIVHLENYKPTADINEWTDRPNDPSYVLVD